MKITQNFHQHSHRSCDEACARIQDIFADMKNLGITHFGITDHVHTSYNLPDLVSSRHDFLLQKPPEGAFFGVEVSCVSQEECDLIAAGKYTAFGDEPVYGLRNLENFDGRMTIGISEKEIRELGVEFVVGGVHWPLGYPKKRTDVIDTYFKEHMFLIEHPLVDVLAHPWDSIALAAGDWYHFRDRAHIDFSIYFDIPKEYNDALCTALLKHNKPAEINLSTLANPDPAIRKYQWDMLTEWKERGVKFTVGDDSHWAHTNPLHFIYGEQAMNDRHFTEDDLVLPGRCGKK